RCLRTVAPAGFDWKDASALPPDARAPRPRSVEYCLQVPAQRRPETDSRLRTLLGSSTWPCTRRRPSRESMFDLRCQLVDAELLDDGVLRFRLLVSPDGSARPEEVLEALALRDLIDRGAVLSRTDLELDG